MGPFSNPNDFQSYIDNIRKPFMEGNNFSAEEIQKRVMESIDQFMPPFMRGQQTQNTNKQTGASPPPTNNYQVFETHDFVIARIPLNQENYYPPKLLMDTYHLYVRNLPNNEKELSIKLPCPIRPKNAKAEFKDGILEVRMLKRGPEPMTEINMSDV